jgi:kojibiose phosphorylase
LTERWSLKAQVGETWRLDRMVTVFTSRETERPAPTAAEHLAYAFHGGADALVRAHRDAWEKRWRAAGVEIEGDESLQRALRFAAYHLISAANPEDERVSIGARTLTGESYKGHVFWDTDVFMLPFYTFTDPRSARALLMYRFHTLDGAREKASELGYRGALYPWESADTGRETTPKFMIAPDGEVLRVLSGLQEHHISADVAWASWLYWKATGDDAFFKEAGAEILLETARFWASRGALEEDGLFHLREIIGPDEYHEGIDDDAFTNWLAQWNLERGAEAFSVLEQHMPEQARFLREKLQLADEEVAQWRSTAEAMYRGFEPSSGLIEQFQGYFGLEEIDLSPMRAQGKRAAPMDMLLGRERTQRSKVVKQADVVMLTAMLWDRVPEPARRLNFSYYEPRTCHGSSLSPAIHALVAARLQEEVLARAYLEQASEIDLANTLGNAAGGVHAAALGGLWQATVFGFGGLHVGDESLALWPHLLEGWKALRFPLVWRGARLVFELEPKALRVRCEEGPESLRVPLILPGQGRCELCAGEVLAAVREGPEWRRR